MKRKNYISPDILSFQIETKGLIMGSQFDNSQDNQSITPTEEQYSDEFQSRRHDVWNDEDEEDY